MPSPNIDRQFEYLDRLPDSLYQKIITLSYGDLKERVEGILVWRSFLIKGKLPEINRITWPEEEISKIILKRIDGLDVIHDCKNQDNLVDEILLAVCDAINSVAKRKQQGIHGMFDDLLDLPFKKRLNESALDPEEGNTPDVDSRSGESSSQQEQIQAESGQPSNPESNPQSIPQSNHQNQPSEESAPSTNMPQNPPINNLQDLDKPLQKIAFKEKELAEFGSQLSDNLIKISHTWKNLKDIFGSMEMVPDRGWDLSTGNLHKQDWQTFSKYRKLIKNNPQIMTIVENLGRSHKLRTSKKDDAKNKSPTLDNTSFIQQDKKTPDPMRIKGITRSDDIARMLPSEAVLLGHPKLKMLWHAKRAEHALLSYQAEGVLSAHIPIIKPDEPNSPNSKKTPKGKDIKGPIILCIDTSGSMKGTPEQLAKAVVLEAVRHAHKEKRRCYLYIFSGPKEIIEQELFLNFNGIKNMIYFLQHAFHGGTDIMSVLEKATHKISNKEWKYADILLVSDGLFKVNPLFANKIKKIKNKQNLRIHGLLIGGWQTDQIQMICQPLYTIKDEAKFH